MKNYIKIYINIALLSVIAAILSSCNNNDEPTPAPVIDHIPAKRTILVYAVAANNLSSNLNNDLKEMTAGMSNIDLQNYRLLVYKVQLNKDTYTPTPQELIEIKTDDSGVVWNTVKTYSSDLRSVDTRRIAEVIQDVQTHAPAEMYGLIFWSHSDAWNPSANYTPPQRSFGQERDGNTYFYCEITDLAAAIPDGWADFIWFDSCYMANIETAYELRNKCRWFVGSTIELDADGMPYNRTLPLLFSEEYTLTDAVALTFNYFESRPCPGAMSVYDMSYIEDVADAVAEVYRNFTPLNDTSELQRYSRSISPVLYDFYQYSTALAAQNGTNADALNQALDKFVVYKQTTPYGWGGMSINPDLYCGISCSVYKATDSKADTFYRTLAWYNKTLK